MEERFLHAGAVEPRKESRERRERHWLFAGLIRLGVILALAIGGSLVIGFLLGRARDWETARSVTYGFYIGGAALLGVGFLGWGGQQYEGGGYVFYENATGVERVMHQNTMAAYVLIGLVVVGLGVLTEVFTT